ncbi:MAG: sugar-binding domain-containing protein [Phycisphaerales bacterium]
MLEFRWSPVTCGAASALGMLALLWTCAAARAQGDWTPAPGHIMTRWAKDVDPRDPLAQYPRATMVRNEWRSLNGLWDYAITGRGEAVENWAGKILVPFAVESALSGVKTRVGPEQALHYRRTFSVPAEWLKDDQRVILHFGAVDWQCTVRVNGREACSHTGGYDPFSADITELVQAGDNEVSLVVTDPTNQGGQPRGKQWSKPHGIWYTPTTGIWQSVWIEPVPYRYVAGLRVDADRSTGEVRVRVTDGGSAARFHAVYEVEVSLNGKRIASGRSPTSPVLLKVLDPRAWTPDSPVLYDLTLRTLIGARRTDEVTSYFAFRDIKVAKDSMGVNRLMLNDKPTFMFGPLDQGFWPDGLYTAPTDEALKFDIEAVKKMGGNMLRKHVKVEPERFYYWCDRLGIMVWQDMPSPFFEQVKEDGSKGWDDDFPALSDEWKTNFEREWRAIIEARRQHPSIVMWVPFNEGWGQNDLGWARSVALKTKEWDPTRLVNNASGWTDMKVGDTLDYHLYPGPGTPPTESSRAAVLGEYGGLGLPLEGHTWVNKDNWGYVSYTSKDDLTRAYLDQIRQLPMLIAEGLCAAVYTQTTDVEIECNGWMTYDREVWKIDPEQAGKATAEALSNVPRGFNVIVPRAGQPGGPGDWAYTYDPLDGWEQAQHDTAGWRRGPGGFGTKGTPGAIIGTEWSATDIYLRREFQAPQAPARNVALSIHHDEDAAVYINGVQVATLSGYTTAYHYIPLSDQAVRAIKWGQNNVIAIHCRQTGGGQYIDCGLVEIVRDEPSKSHAPAPARMQQQPGTGPPAAAREDSRDYESRQLGGFTLRINKDFSTSAPELLDRVLVQLAGDLDEISHFVPPAALDALRTVTIWIERQGSTAMGRGGRGMCCHWSPGWLESNGLLTEKAGGVEIINPDDFLTWRRDQPYMCFHELAHALHWRLAKLDPEIEEVFERAKAAGRYDQVARNSLPQGTTERAYAITNRHEYFAELSEAYFALNDFYPYSRRQLQTHDPEGFRLIERVWNLSAEDIAANAASREPGR